MERYANGRTHEFAQHIPHHRRKAVGVEVPEELMEALKFCTEKSAKFIDEKRREFLQCLKDFQLEVEDERVQWLADEVASPHKGHTKYCSAVSTFL